MADVSAIASCLQATLLPDQQQRQAAELQLQEAAMQPGYSVALFRLAVDNTLQAEPVLRQTFEANASHFRGLLAATFSDRLILGAFPGPALQRQVSCKIMRQKIRETTLDLDGAAQVAEAAALVEWADGDLERIMK